MSSASRTRSATSSDFNAGSSVRDVTVLPFLYEKHLFAVRSAYAKSLKDVKESDAADAVAATGREPDLRSPAERDARFFRQKSSTNATTMPTADAARASRAIQVATRK